MALTTGILIGFIVSGFIAFFHILPDRISMQRGKDLEVLNFFDSDEGKILKKMIELNKDYFPNKCQEEAKKNGISLAVNGYKVSKVCVLRVP